MATQRSLDIWNYRKGGVTKLFYRNTSDVARVLRDVAGEHEELSLVIALLTLLKMTF